jgi:hypothetical protein
LRSFHNTQQGGAVGVGTMHFIQEYLTALFGWHVMRRQCYVERQSSMKNYEEFRGQSFKLEFDAGSNSFIYVAAQNQKPMKSAETFLFKPKQMQQETPIRTKTRRVA